MKSISVSILCMHTLVFLEPPTAPQSLKVVDINKDNVTLKWQPPVSDGGADVTEYVVEMKPCKQKKFAVVGEVPQNTPFFKATELKEGQTYEFRVRAKNVVGLGEEAAVLDSPVTAKAKSTVGMLRYHTVTKAKSAVHYSMVFKKMALIGL